MLNSLVVIELDVTHYSRLLKGVGGGGGASEDIGH